ncbi:hypothetical protein JYU23_01150 [bacterium AH-315-C07]|nr:hypothetical protein [bacterium AH-315-C07]
MRYLLLPITMLLWWYVIFYSLFFSVTAMLFVFSFSWFWLIIIGFTGIALIAGILNTIPAILNLYIFKFYNYSWVGCIAQSLAGLLGAYRYFTFIYANPPVFTDGTESVFFLSYMWNEAPVKTVFVISAFLGVFIAILWSMILSPILLKISNKGYEKIQ